MSVIDDLIIAIDDKPGITKQEILAIDDGWQNNRSAVFSALARLQSKGFVQENSLGYRVSDSGKARIDKILAVFDEFKNENKKWFLMLVEIPDSKKLLREKLRYELIKIGAGNLKRGVYLIYRSTSHEIKVIVEKLNLDKNYTLLEISYIFEPNPNQIILAPWDWKKLNDQYQKFLDTHREFTKNAKNLPKEIKRIEAKKAVFALAKILRQDPLLKDDISPSSHLRKKSFRLYETIRHFCY